MKKVFIDGMMCEHCKAHVKSALNAIDGVTAEVNLEEGYAEITGNAENKIIEKAVTDAGYTVTKIEG